MCVSDISIDEFLIADIAREHIDDEDGIWKWELVVGLAPEFLIFFLICRSPALKIIKFN